MPTIYLSPSTQQANPYITGGTEEYYMNRLADAMVPYLRSSGIQYTRNTPDMTAASSIRASNAGNYDVHLALHSNAAPDALSGQIRGTDVYFYPGSTSGRRLADLLVDNLKQVYPNPAKVRAVPTTSLGEVSRTRAPGVLIEYAYHDNVEDANWIKNNLDSIARATVRALTEYFGIPFVEPQPAQEGQGQRLQRISQHPQQAVHQFHGFGPRLRRRPHHHPGRVAGMGCGQLPRYSGICRLSIY